MSKEPTDTEETEDRAARLQRIQATLEAYEKLRKNTSRNRKKKNPEQGSAGETPAESISVKSATMFLRLTSAQTIFDLSMILVKAVAGVLPSKSSYVLVYSPTIRALRLAAPRGNGKFHPYAPIEPGTGTAGRVFLTGKSITDEKNLLAIPLANSTSTFGVLCLHSPKVTLSPALWNFILSLVKIGADKCISESKTWNGVPDIPPPGHPFRKCRERVIADNAVAALDDAAGNAFSALDAAENDLKVLLDGEAPEPLIPSRKAGMSDSGAAASAASADSRGKKIETGTATVFRGPDGEILSPEAVENVALRRAARTAIGSIQRARRIIQNAVQAPNMAAAGLDPVKKPVVLLNLLNELCAGFPTAFQSGRLDLSVLLDSKAKEPQIICDPEKLTEALGYLLDNALVFSPKNEMVSFEISCTPDRMAVLKIHDHGIGIPQDEISRVTEPFFRARNAPVIAGALGIGCTTAKRIIELHGGTLSFESELNVGTTAIVTLPLAPAIHTPKKIGKLRIC